MQVYILVTIYIPAHEHSTPAYNASAKSKNERPQKCPEGIHNTECLDRTTVMDTEVRPAQPDEQSFKTTLYTREASTSSSSSGKEETYVKQLTSSSSTHQQSAKKPCFFLEEHESQKSFCPSLIKPSRTRSQNELGVTSAATCPVGEQTLSERSLETDCFKGHSVTEFQLSFRHSGSTSGSVSDTALSKVRRVMCDLTPEQERTVTDDSLETAGYLPHI